MLFQFANKFGNKFASKWIILLMDMCILASSFIFAYALRFTFNIQNISYNVYGFAYYIVIRFIVHLAFQTYTGIIRHTSMEDIANIFKTIITGSIIIKFFEMFIIRNLIGESDMHILTQILIIEFFISFFLLVASRFFVKISFDTIVQNTGNVVNTYIYGAGNSGRTTKRVLLADKTKKHIIKAFIDDNPSIINKKLEGIPVYDLNNFLAKNQVEKGDEVVIAIDNLDVIRKNEIAETFLQKGIVVKAIPSIKSFINGEFKVEQIANIKIEDLLERPVINLNINKIQKELTGKTIMVTGAAGSIGSEIVRQLIKFAPEKIVLLDQGESALYDFEFELKSQFENYLAQTTLELVIASVSDETRMRYVFKNTKPNIVFHAAAYKHVPLMESNPYEAVKTNVLGSKTVADLAMEYGVNKFVLVSTDKAVNPTNVMGATKRLAEMYIQSLNKFEVTKFICTRFGNVLGSNGSVIPLFTKQIASGGPVTVTHPDITRYFMTIPEASQLVLEAGAMGNGEEVFVFDMGSPVKVHDLAKKMIQLSGYEVNKDIKIVFSGLRPGEKLYEELLNDNENTMPTYHPKILRAKINTISFTEMEIAMGKILYTLENESYNKLIKLLKYYVPEYISNNSVFEKYDVKK